jgi:hypothetical protein
MLMKKLIDCPMSTWPFHKLVLIVPAEDTAENKVKYHWGIYSFLCKKLKTGKNFWGNYWLVIRLWHLGMHLIEVGKHFFRTQSCHTSKDAEFNVDFKNINLHLWQNAPIKRYFKIPQNTQNSKFSTLLSIIFLRCILLQR